MQKEIKHTPTSPSPWRIVKGSLGDMDFSSIEVPNQVICQIIIGEDDPELDKANAEFIVRACNSHYDLLEALKKSAAFIEAAFDEHESLIEHYTIAGSACDPEYRKEVNDILALFKELEAVISKLEAK